MRGASTDDAAIALLLDRDANALSREELLRLVADLQRELAARLGTSAPVTASARQSPRAIAGVDFTLVFDGGSLGNPGRGYGSYEVVSAKGRVAAQQVDFGPNMTNNQAEFRTLIAGLEALAAIIGEKTSETSVAVRGDSQLVIRGLTGEWKVKHPGLQPLHRRANELLSRFGSVDLAWHPRRESVRTLGH